MSELNRLRRVKSATYTTISNVIVRDSTISLKAKGLMVTIMGLPDDWDFTVAGLQTLLVEGREALHNTLNELIDHGYVVREQHRDEHGVFKGNTYHFHEEPQRRQEEPHTGFPNTEEQPQLKTYLNKDLSNKKHSSPKKPKTELITRPDIESDAEWLEGLSGHEKYKHLPVHQRYSELLEWCGKKNLVPTRRRLITWLNRDLEAVPITPAIQALNTVKPPPYFDLPYMPVRPDYV